MNQALIIVIWPMAVEFLCFFPSPVRALVVAGSSVTNSEKWG